MLPYSIRFTILVLGKKKSYNTLEWVLNLEHLKNCENTQSSKWGTDCDQCRIRKMYTLKDKK